MCLKRVSSVLLAVLLATSLSMSAILGVAGMKGDTSHLKDKLAAECPECCYAMLPIACYLPCDALCGSDYFSVVGPYMKGRGNWTQTFQCFYISCQLCEHPWVIFFSKIFFSSFKWNSYTHLYLHMHFCSVIIRMWHLMQICVIMYKNMSDCCIWILLRWRK